MVLDTSLLNTQQYKVHIKVKVEQSREHSYMVSSIPIEYKSFLNKIYLTPRWNLNRYYTTEGQGGSGSNYNEIVLHTPQISRTGALPSDTV